MQKSIRIFGIVLLSILAGCGGGTKNGVTIWPLLINSGNILARVTEPQAESFAGNVLMAHATVSVKESDTSEPVFGTIWFSGIVKKGDTSRMELENLDLTDLRFSDMSDTAGILNIKTTLARQLQNSSLAFSGGKIRTQLEQSGSGSSGSGINTAPPHIIYTTVPTILILIDGNPILEKIPNSTLERVVNTPFLLVKDNEDGKYYLDALHQWFASAEVKGPWHKINILPPGIAAVDQQVREQAKNEGHSEEEDSGVIPDILISTEPCELIQTDGLAVLTAIEGTDLMAISNTRDQIFRERDAQQYYVLLTGRWYTATTLQGPWSYVDPARLPADFAKIPEGGEKDVVLASVPGSRESQDAVHDARVPMTAKVDRKNAKAEVRYNGTPKFENVEGASNVQYAANTSSSVLKIAGNYYVVDDGVWYVSSGPEGPWEVATKRPEEVNSIPPSSPVYDVRYVYIYDVTPEYVYVGYTPGYTGCYVHGPTVVYGTGYYYQPWYANVYYPRPWTWGFGMWYNPWYGWGYNPRYDWYSPPPQYWYGYQHHHYGWWGPPGYRPPYYPPLYSDNGRPGGYYGPRRVNDYHPRAGVSPAPMPRPVNLYEGRQAVRPTRHFDTRSHVPSSPPPGTKPAVQPGVRPGINPHSGVQPGTNPAVRPEVNPHPGVQPGTRPAKEDNRKAPEPGIKPGEKPGTTPVIRPGGNLQPGTKNEPKQAPHETRKIPDQNKTPGQKPPEHNRQPAPVPPGNKESNPDRKTREHQTRPPQQEIQPAQPPKHETEPAQQPVHHEVRPAQPSPQNEPRSVQQQRQREARPPQHQTNPQKRETQPAQQPVRHQAHPPKRVVPPAQKPQKRQPSKPANNPGGQKQDDEKRK